MSADRSLRTVRTYRGAVILQRVRESRGEWRLRGVLVHATGTVDQQSRWAGNAELDVTWTARVEMTDRVTPLAGGRVRIVVEGRSGDGVLFHDGTIRGLTGAPLGP